MKVHSGIVLIIGAFLTMIGLDVLAGPEWLVVTPAHAIAFDFFGRGPLGVALMASGLVTVYEGYKGSKRYIGIYTGVLNSLFWFVVTLLPLFTGVLMVNGVSTLAWLMVAGILAYQYVLLRMQNKGLVPSRLS